MSAEIEAAIERAKEWMATVPEGQLGAAMKAKFIEVGAFMYLAPADMQHEMLQFLGTTVLRMPLFILGTAQWDREMDLGSMTGLMVDVKAQFNPAIAPALGPVAEKLRHTAEALAVAAASSDTGGHTQVIYDSDKKERGQA
jgi:hypothetical protein